MTIVEATVYRGTKEGSVIEEKETFTPGDEELLLKVPFLTRAQALTGRLLIPGCAVLTCTISSMDKS